nr:hypothetical protein [Streptomyces mexicanus]
MLGALALTACDSGGSDSGAGGRGRGNGLRVRLGDCRSGTDGSGSAGSGSGSGSSGAASAPPGASAGSSSGGTGATTGTAAGVDGSWLTTADGKMVVLIVNGGQAALFSTGGTTCTGTAGERGRTRLIRLTRCKARMIGTVDSVNKTTLKVTWEGGLGTETYTRAQGGTLPSGLPTASLGS